MILLLATAWAYDLDGVRAAAEARAVDVAIAEASAEAARAEAWEAAGASLPSVVGFADVTTGAGRTSFGFERPVATQIGVGVSGSWTLVSPSGWAAAGAARRTAKGEAALLDWARLVARTEATTRYAAVLAAQDVLAAWERALADAEKQADAATRLVTAGLQPPADRARAEAAREGARARFVGAQGELAAACASLQGLLRDPVTGECTAEATEWAVRPHPPEHPALVAAEEALAAARASKVGAWLDLAPEVEVTGTAAEYVADGAAGFGWNAGVGVDVPLVVGGGASIARARAASARVKGQEAALDGTRIDLDVARIAAGARLESARAALVALEAAVASANDGLRLVEERYGAGLEGLTTLLEARAARDAAAVALAEGKAAVGRAVADLEAAGG